MTGQLSRCFCKVFAFPEDYNFSPAPPSRSRARAPGTPANGASHASTRRLSDDSNPWNQIHSRDKGDGDVSNPVVLLALCLGVDRSSAILKVYQSRQRTDVTGRMQASKDAFNRL